MDLFVLLKVGVVDLPVVAGEDAVDGCFSVIRFLNIMDNVTGSAETNHVCCNGCSRMWVSA